MLFYIGRDEAPTCGSRAIKRDFRALRWQLKELNAQIIYFSPACVLVRTRKPKKDIIFEYMASWLTITRTLGFFWQPTGLCGLGLLALDGLCLSWIGRRALGQKLVGLIENWVTRGRTCFQITSNRKDRMHESKCQLMIIWGTVTVTDNSNWLLLFSIGWKRKEGFDTN